MTDERQLNAALTALRDKRRQLADCYARLGLKPGRVWAKALGKKAAS